MAAARHYLRLRRPDLEPWSASQELGLAEIDEAHRGLDEMMQVAMEAVDKGSAPAVEAILVSYAEATRAHFVIEEGLMRQSGYAGMAAHLEAHAAYLKDVEGASRQFASAGLGTVFQLWFHSRLAPWFRLHIRGSDAQFVRHYKGWQERAAKAGEASLMATVKT